MSDSIVYLNGEFVPLDQAQVPVLDRGFIFGDGVYEVVPVYRKTPFRLEEHLRRLDNSLRSIRIDNPCTPDEWQTIISQLIERNAGPDQSVYLQVTRGVAKRDHGFPENFLPTVFGMSNPMSEPDPEQIKQGGCAITLDDTRWQHCDIKAVTLLANILLRQQAIDAGCIEAILIRDGEVTEGAASNVFVVHNKLIRTPPKDSRVLPGITRDVVIELARSNGLTCEEKAISGAELQSADEIWITSSTREIMPITLLDGKVVGNGKAGAMWQQLYALYQQHKHKLRNSA